MVSAVPTDFENASIQSKEFLGRGWKFPINTGKNLTINPSRFEESVNDSILIILGTRKGERLMRPDFGCGIHDFVFEPVNSITLGHMELSITEALTKYEPRINLININLSDENIDKGILL